MVFAVNSGGVALITGDVTTLMIFLAGKVAILQLLALAVPAFVAVMVLAAMLSIGMKGEVVVQGHRNDVRGVDVAIALIFLCTILSTIIGNFLFQIPPVLTFLAGLSVMFLVARFFSDDNDSDPILSTCARLSSRRCSSSASCCWWACSRKSACSTGWCTFMTRCRR